MGLFNFTKTSISNKTSQIGDSLSRNAARVTNRFSSSNSANKIYIDLANSTRSFGAKVLLDSKLSKSNLKTLSNLSKNLSMFDEKTIEKLYHNFESNPDGLNKRIANLTKSYLEELTQFVQKYHETLKEINEELLNVSKEESKNNEFIFNTLEELKDIMDRSNTYIPPNLILETEKTLNNLFIEEKKEDIKDYETDANEINKEQIADHSKTKKFGFFKYLGKRVKGSKYCNKIIKLTKVFEKLEQKDMLNNLRLMKEQVFQRKIQPDFFVRFTKHIRGVREFDRMLDQITKDAIQIINLMKSLIEPVKTSMSLFASAFGNSPALKQGNFQELLMQLKKLDEEEYNILKQDENNKKTLYSQVKNFYLNSNNIFKDLMHTSNIILNKVKADPSILNNK
ncbi:MAG: hypothetical protein AB7V77_02815 [Candidatus Woesearchaeota archaeon]